VTDNATRNGVVATSWKAAYDQLAVDYPGDSDGEVIEVEATEEPETEEIVLDQAA